MFFLRECGPCIPTSMTKQNAASTMSSAFSRGGKLHSAIFLDGVKTPGPRRRRKQPQTVSKTPSAAVASSLDNYSSSPNDEDYSFASTSAISRSSGTAVASIIYNVAKRGRKAASSSRLTAAEKENYINDGSRSAAAAAMVP